MTLELDGLTVLIGENGSGKSSILEALEMLRKAALPGNYVDNYFAPIHGELSALLGRGAQELRITATIEGRGHPLRYHVALAAFGAYARVVSESLAVFGVPKPIPPLLIDRDATGCRVFDARLRKMVDLPLEEGKLVLSLDSAMLVEPIARTKEALAAIQVHVPFDVRPRWVAIDSPHRPPAAARGPAEVGAADDLERGGGNLANCYFTLAQNSSPEVWQAVIADVRTGVGLDLVDVRTVPGRRGHIELGLLLRGWPTPLPASSLSDGQLSYLGMVALAHLGNWHSVVAFDEPEAHLHPALMVRTAWLFERIGERTAVLLASHSDVLLDALDDPGKSVVLSELDASRSTVLKRPDPKALAEWLLRYRGFGTLRAEGYASAVFGSNRDAT